MINIYAMEGGARTFVASGDAVKGIRYNGKICTRDYVFQELEQQGSIPLAVITKPRELPRAGRGSDWSRRILPHG
jgi:hypothetical protein